AVSEDGWAVVRRALHCGDAMRLLGRMSLQTKVLLIQVGIVLLVAGLISATVVSFLANLVEQQAGERALGVGQAVALMPEVRNAFDSPDPPAQIQPLAEAVHPAPGARFGVLRTPELI